MSQSQTDPATDLRSAYDASVDENWWRLSKIAAIVAFVLVPAGITLDAIVFPSRLELFTTLRLACDLLIALMFATYFTRFGERYFRIITFIWLLSIQAMICYMIVLTDGPLSPYYAGLNLSVLAVGFFLPTSLYETLLFCVLTLVFFFISIATFEFNELNIHVAYNNAYFLVLTSVITLFASYFNGKRRFEEFRLNFELDKRNREMAEMDRMKSDFFANVSHELRTPLTLILSPIQDILERQTQLPDYLASTLGVVRNNALRLLKLVNDLLDVIRMEEGKVQLDREPIVIDTFLGGIADSMIHLADIQGTELQKQLHSPGISVLGDRNALEKVFINLLNNAIKFTPEEGEISIGSETAGDRIRVTVSDTGIGIDHHDLPHVFDRFRQADGSTTRRYQGTGLGLALVKELTERHAGTVSVTSTRGEGTTMTVELPVFSTDTSPEAETVTPPEAAIGIQKLHRLAEINTGLSVASHSEWEMDNPELDPDSDKASVLVVDDEVDMRNYLVESLRDEYQVIYAKDGLAGLKMAQESLPELMLLDLMLPELDGLEVCRRLKQDERTRGIKIILLTARVDEEAKLTALNNGADDFLTKPFSSLEVRTRLNNLHVASRLEQDLNQRNLELNATLQDLRQAQGQLVQSEKLNALGKLSAGLLHEINNPLNYTLTALQIAAMIPDVKNNPDLDEIVTDMKEGLDRIRVIVTDLRAFAYPEEAAKQQPFDIRKAIEIALRFSATDLGDAEIEQQLDQQHMVRGSQSHIVQVLVNVLTNGAKAVAARQPVRQGHFKIDSRVIDGRLQVSVSDDGIGMEPDVLARIFDPFFTTRDVGEGMGLGLSVCHTIINNHGGTLSATSEPGEGSRFSFDLELEGNNG